MRNTYLDCYSHDYAAVGTGTRNDCVLRTMTLLTGIDYAAWVDYFADIRTPGGVSLHAWERRIYALGLRPVPLSTLEAWCTLGRFIRTFPTGAYAVTIARHMLLVKDGILNDWVPRAKRCRVYSAWYVLGSVPPHPLLSAVSVL